MIEGTGLMNLRTLFFTGPGNVDILGILMEYIEDTEGA